MDQPRPRYQGLISPLIERADLQSPRQRTVYGALTVGFWLFWIYLWVPVLALLAWLLGLQQAYKYMIVLGGWHEVLQVVGTYSLIIFLMGGGLLVWAAYNIFRFGGVEHRMAALPVTPADIGLAFGLDPEALTRWQSEPRLLVAHEDDGRIARVEVLGR